MNYSRFQKLNIKEGNDMFPSILPDEKLLLDKGAKPQIGDVILIKNSLNLLVAHRLVHKFIGYYLTRGDNCRSINLPIRKKDILGVVVGKKQEIRKTPIMNTLLDLFLIQYLLTKPFREKELKKSKILFILAGCFWPVETIYFNHKRKNELNKKIFGGKIEIKLDSFYKHKIEKNKIILNCPELFNRSSRKIYLEKFNQRKLLHREYNQLAKELKKSKIEFDLIKGLSYPYVRDIGDNDLISSEFEKIGDILKKKGYLVKYDTPLETSYWKKIGSNFSEFDIHKHLPSIEGKTNYPFKKNEKLNDYKKLLLTCTHCFQQGHLNIRDLIDINYLLRKVNLDEIEFKDKGIYEILGFPLITLYIFDKKYNFGKNKKLRLFINKNYKNYITNIQRFYVKRKFYKKTKLFKMYKYSKSYMNYYGGLVKNKLIDSIIGFVIDLERKRLNKYSREKL